MKIRKITVMFIPSSIVSASLSTTDSSAVVPDRSNPPDHHCSSCSAFEILFSTILEYISACPSLQHGLFLLGRTFERLLPEPIEMSYVGALRLLRLPSLRGLTARQERV